MKLIIQDEDGRDIADRKTDEPNGVSLDMLTSTESVDGVHQPLISAPKISSDELKDGQKTFREYSGEFGVKGNVTDVVEDVGKRKSGMKQLGYPVPDLNVFQAHVIPSKPTVFITDLDIPERFKTLETSATSRFEEGPVSTSKLLEVCA